MFWKHLFKKKETIRSTTERKSTRKKNYLLLFLNIFGETRQKYCLTDVVISFPGLERFFETGACICEFRFREPAYV